MRVYHVVRQFWPSVGGLEDVVEHLAREQMARGWGVKIITLDRVFAAPAERLAAEAVHGGLEILRLPYRGSSRYPLAPTVLNALSGADLLHVHAVDFFFDFLALTRFLHAKPQLATTHGGFFHTEAYAGLKRLWFNTITRASVTAYEAIVACGEADYDMFAPLARGNLHRIDNGVDIVKFAGCSSPIPAQHLATIGRFSTNKRLDRLLDMMQCLVATDEAWRLDIIGAPSDWPLARLESEIAARRLEPQVRILAAADNAAIARVLGEASFFVSASEHEGFGLAAVEALSAGLRPVLHGNAAFRALKARCDMVEIVDFADPAGAAAAILRLWSEAATSYPQLRQKARDAARQFAWPGVAEAYLALYEAILAKRKTSAQRG